MTVLKINNKQYLKNGDRFWPGSFSDADLVLNNAFGFSTFREFLEASDELNGRFSVLENWAYEDIILSSFTFISNGNDFTKLNWSLISIYLLFAEKPSVSNHLFLFLQENIPLNNILFFKQDMFFLYSMAYSDVQIGNLENFLNFLSVEEGCREILIQDCLEAKDYSPLLSFVFDLESYEKNSKEERPAWVSRKCTKSFNKKIPLEEDSPRNSTFPNSSRNSTFPNSSRNSNFW